MIPNGPKNKVRTYRRLLSFIKRGGLSPSSQFFSNHPELIEGFAISQESRPIAQNSDHPKIAVCLHLFYTELWDEIESLLSQWDISFHLFITLNAENTLLSKKVKLAFPNSTIVIVANKGRDVRPFLTILDKGLLSKFDLVCKIHGKRSSDNERIEIFGDVIRRAIFLDLIYPVSQVRLVLQVFKDSPRVGIVGPERLLVSSRNGKKRDVFGQNRVLAEGLVDRMGGLIGSDDFDFFEGTMFWVRPEALQPLRELELSVDFFDDESGKGDGAPEHALERLFNYATRIAGYEVAAVSLSLNLRKF
jgi:lipopolysaccharide biosynthesis protein